MHKHPAHRLRGIQRRDRHRLFFCPHAPCTPRHPTRLTLSQLPQNVIRIQLLRLCLKMPLWAHRCKRCRHGSKCQEKRRLSQKILSRCEVLERWCERHGVVIYKCVVVVASPRILVRHLHLNLSQVVEAFHVEARGSARCDVQRAYKKSRL